MTEMIRQSVLVTGGTGFVGSHLARRLVQEGHSVHLVVTANSDMRQIRDILDKVTLHEHDGSTDLLIDIVGRTSPGVVFHLASLFLAQHGPGDITPLVRSNVLFATQLVEAMATHGIPCLVNTGTSWQHYENKPYSPVNLYAATKQAFEAILQYYVEVASLRVITLKLFDTYGPADLRPKLFTLLRRIAGEQQYLAMSPGEQLLDLLYIDDVVNAFLAASDRLLSRVVTGHESYAVSSGNPMQLREVVATYSKVTGKQLPIDWGGREYRDREVMIPWDKGVAVPGWRPRIVLEEGIRLMEFPEKL